MKKKTNDKGITLVVLVITIVLLLILASVTIGAINGGLFNYAGDAKNKAEQSGEITAIQTAFITATDNSKTGKITATDLLNELKDYNATVTDIGKLFVIKIDESKEYILNLKGEVVLKNPNDLDVNNISNSSEVYYGYDVINYAQTLPQELQNTQWQLFYSGKIDESDPNEEKHIYLILNGALPNTLLPTVKRNGVKLTRETVDDNNEPITEDIRPINVDGSDYKAYFADLNKNNGIITEYSSINFITNPEIRKLIKQYYDYILVNGGGNGRDAKSMAYMLDSETWEDFAGTNADYAIGGPTAELFVKSFNNYKKQNNKYQTIVSSINGYRFSINNGVDFANAYQILEP